ncbi:MAG: acyltransferase [Muribaculaceae bacterium]|nr:acyltransferase [Muribaculaceae bacterium]
MDKPNTDGDIFHYISHDNNMNVVRYVLALLVLLAHYAFLTGLDVSVGWLSYIGVGGFFSLSGFLLFASFQRRQKMKHYISRRAKKILPPYCFIVLLCAMSLWAVSDLSVGEYFSSSGFWAYLGANLSFMNFLHPGLPGVFDGEAFLTPAVNGSLWTMKGEWICYLSVPFVFFMMKRWRRHAGTLLLGVIALLMAMKICLYEVSEIPEYSRVQLYGKQFEIFMYFYIGALVNLCYPLFLKYKWWVLGVNIIIAIFSDYIPLYGEIIQPFVIGTSVLWFSLVGKWGASLSRHDNVSYDMYLYHFPIIQLWVYLGMTDRISPVTGFMIILGATVVLAEFSWNFIGKQFYRGERKKIEVHRIGR